MLHLDFMTGNVIYKGHDYNGLAADGDSYMVNFLHSSIHYGMDSCVHTKGI